MTYRTLEGVLHPDGKVTLAPADLPGRPVRVMVTILEPEEETELSDVGDYLEKLSEYEKKLARGEIHWQ